ncbi:MAG: stage V sporulation protein D, partial [Oscillospiraceae bacterium]|nr:stage V sporulation protein D [Oscillospiraceae bacterium]
MTKQPNRPRKEPVPKAAVKKKKKERSVRLAKLVIQRRTLALLLVFGVFAFLALFAKAYDLTINQNKELQDLASSQQMRSTILTASRGSIYDRNGITLAISATADTVFLDPKVIEEQAQELDKKRAEKLLAGLKKDDILPISGQEYKDLIARKMAEILDMDEQTIYDQMAKTSWRYAELRKRVDKEIGDKVREFITDNETGETIQGIHLSSDSKRYYPHSTLAAHAIGWLDIDNHGAYGLEALYEEELEGTTGLTVTAKDGSTNSEIMFQYEQYYDAEDGCSLQTTLDATIQSYVERGLEDMVHKFGAKNGAAGVVLDPRSGAILAAASYPTYDLNNQRSIYEEELLAQLAKVDEEYPPEEGNEHSTEYWEKLKELQLLQWRNKAVGEPYDPGSTFKIVTLAMALEEGTVTPQSTFYCDGHYTVDDWDIKCSRTTGHGMQDLALAAGNSCNPAFINIGFSVGGSVFYDYLEAFNLTNRTGVDLQGDTKGIFTSRKNFTTIDLACYSFGQNFKVTPLQMITAQAACINGGYLYQPYVVEKVVDGDGNVVMQHDATPIRQVISEETSATVREILEFVVTVGTGRNGQVAGYRLGGKTGTADQADRVSDDPKGDIVVSFLCFAPADDPQVIMLLTLDTPRRDTGTYPSGGNMVAPTAAS